MNYLAHLYLAKGQSGLVAGGFLADFVKGPLKGAYSEDIETGMRLHRRIDSWSDEHAAIKQFKLLLPTEFNRYAGIIADVLGDHFLCRQWLDHSDENLEDFARNQLSILEARKDVYPERAQWVLARMIDDQWLTRYQNIDHCLAALGHIGQRLKRDNPLHKLELPIEENYQQLGELCAEILGDLKLNVAEWRADNL